MNIPPLTTLAINKLPLLTLLQQDLLNQPFPPEVLVAIKSKLTLENLYNEGLLEDLTLLQRWKGLFPPKIQDNLHAIKAILGSPGIPYSLSPNRTIIWDYFNAYRLFDHEGSNGFIPDVRISSAPDLDAFVHDLLVVTSGRLGMLQVSPFSQKILPSRAKVALQALAEASIDDFEDLLMAVNDYALGIYITEELDFSLSTIGSGFLIYLIGDYLYFFDSDSYLYYEFQEDGKYILAPLLYNPSKWKFVS